MSNGITREPIPKHLALLSAAGSFASIIALLIVLVQQASQEHDIPAEFMVWRLIFGCVALVATGCVAVTAYLLCQGVWFKNSAPLAKVLSICIVIMIALVVGGACIDGLFSALYWTEWLDTPRHLLRWMVSGPGNVQRFPG